MNPLRSLSATGAVAAMVLAAVFSLFALGQQEGEALPGVDWFGTPLLGLIWLVVFAVALWMLWRPSSGPLAGLILLATVVLGAYASLMATPPGHAGGWLSLDLWAFVLALGLLTWRGMALLSESQVENKALSHALDVIIPAAFGLWLLFLWEIIVRGFGIPQVLLPAPGAIGHAMAERAHILSADFYQTFVKSVLSGYALGCGSGFLIGIMVDRVPFLQRGLLPLGNLVSALPIIGVAPIMVMWFGFAWQSKAAVVIIMTFFPMLVNTLAGLAATEPMEKELMRSYAAGYFETLIKLRLPNALPFIFNALKINSTLALIGAIVAEFFGTPIVGMGFRISTEVGRMNLDMVWATIAVAAVAGSLFYGAVALIERRMTFWHPSYRK